MTCRRVFFFLAEALVLPPAGRGETEDVAAGGANNRRKASPAAKGKSPATKARVQMPVAGQVVKGANLGVMIPGD